MNQFAIVIGAMSSYGVSYSFPFSGNWRAMFALRCRTNLGVDDWAIVHSGEPALLARRALR